MAEQQSRYKPRVPLSLRPSWGPPPPLPLASVSPPQEPGEGGGVHTRLRVKGRGSPDSEDWRKSLALCLLYGQNHEAQLHITQIKTKTTFMIGSVRKEVRAQPCEEERPRYARPMVVARVKGMANQVRPPRMNPQTPCASSCKCFSSHFWLKVRTKNYE